METEIIRIAREWIDTPYIHNASLKGIGCDCLGLLVGVWGELIGEVPSFPHYSPDWGEITKEEVMYNEMKKHMIEIPPSEAKLGDVLVFRMLRSYPAKHCGILSERNGVATIIHSRMGQVTSEEDLTKEWKRRIAFAFRFPGV